MNDRIFLENLEFYAFHGCFEEERLQGQTFLISLMMEADIRRAALLDDLAQTIDCGAVYDIVKHIAVDRRFDLIETLAEEISSALLRNFAMLERVTVRVDKPDAPGKDGNFHSAVEIVRER